MLTPSDLAQWVLEHQTLQETHWLEWKNVSLGEREWQASAAKFVLGAANRPSSLARTAHGGHAFFLVGVQPGQVVGTPIVDSAVVDAGLARYLGTSGPRYNFNYVTVQGQPVAVVTVLPTATGHRPYLARGSFSKTKLVLQDGRIYIRRSGLTEEATSAEVDDMLTERVAARVIAGPRWPLRPVDAWRDGKTIHLRKERGDKVMIEEADLYSNLVEMASERPELPQQTPEAIRARVEAAFDPLLDLADTEPDRAIEDAWQPLREVTVEVYRALLARQPPYKVIDMVAELAVDGRVDSGWVDVAYPLYYWPIDNKVGEPGRNPASARTYVSLAKALATALLLAA